MKMWMVLSLLCLLTPLFMAHEGCHAPQPDENVYMFAYGTDYMPFMDVNEDYEPIGLNYDVTRAICKVMNKKCEHVVFYDYYVCWDNTFKSISLNDGWWDACVGFMQIQSRRTANGFLANFVLEPPSYLYVRRGDSDDTVEKVNRNARKIGFREGWWMDPSCLERTLGVSVAGRIEDQFATIGEMKDALAGGQIDAMFADAVNVGVDNRFVTVHDDNVTCAHAGNSYMMRKDKMEKMMWLEEGLQKIRDNGEYDWICRNQEQYGVTGCFK